MARDWKAARAAGNVLKKTAIGSGVGFAGGVVYDAASDDPKGVHKGNALMIGTAVGALGGAGYGIARSLKVGNMTHAVNTAEYKGMTQNELNEAMRQKQASIGKPQRGPITNPTIERRNHEQQMQRNLANRPHPEHIEHAMNLHLQAQDDLFTHQLRDLAPVSPFIKQPRTAPTTGRIDSPISHGNTTLFSPEDFSMPSRLDTSGFNTPVNPIVGSSTSENLSKPGVKKSNKANRKRKKNRK